MASRDNISLAATPEVRSPLSSPVHPSERFDPSPLFTDEDFPPLVSTGTKPLSPSSPITSPSFSDPTLQKSLSIFLDKTPLSPSVLPLDSIRFENVTIRRKKKSKPPLNAVPAPYTPMSTRLKEAERMTSSSPQRVLRALTPLSLDS